MLEYCNLVHKVHTNSSETMSANAPRQVALGSFKLLVDILVPIALARFLPLLEIVHHLVKFSQQRDTSLYDYLAMVKVCQGL